MKITDSAQCDTWYQALLERAAEYTGVFFVGVKTTGVFLPVDLSGAQAQARKCRIF